MEEGKNRFEYPAEILPQNDRTKDIEARRAAEEAARRAQADELRLQREREDKDRKKKERDLKKMKE